MALVSGVMGALFLAVIEGMSVVLMNKLSAPPQPPELIPNDPEVLESLPETEPWWKKIFSSSSPQTQEPQPQQREPEPSEPSTDKFRSYSDSSRGTQEALRGERYISFDDWSDEDEDEMH